MSNAKPSISVVLFAIATTVWASVFITSSARQVGHSLPDPVVTFQPRVQTQALVSVLDTPTHDYVGRGTRGAEIGDLGQPDTVTVPTPAPTVEAVRDEPAPTPTVQAASIGSVAPILSLTPPSDAVSRVQHFLGSHLAAPFAQEIVTAAVTEGISWQLLASLVLLESPDCMASCGNNFFGWSVPGGGYEVFATPSDGIWTVAIGLSRSVWGTDLDSLLARYKTGNAYDRSPDTVAYIQRAHGYLAMLEP